MPTIKTAVLNTNTNIEADQKIGGLLLSNGDWMLLTGGWLLSNGGWLLSNGSWLLSNGGWLLSNGGWLLSNSSWLLTNGGLWFSKGHGVSNSDASNSQIAGRQNETIRDTTIYVGWTIQQGLVAVTAKFYLKSLSSNYGKLLRISCYIVLPSAESCVTLHCRLISSVR